MMGSGGGEEGPGGGLDGGRSSDDRDVRRGCAGPAASPEVTGVGGGGSAPGTEGKSGDDGTGRGARAEPGGKGRGTVAAVETGGCGSSRSGGCNSEGSRIGAEPGTGESGIPPGAAAGGGGGTASGWCRGGNGSVGKNSGAQVLESGRGRNVHGTVEGGRGGFPSGYGVAAGVGCSLFRSSRAAMESRQAWVVPRVGWAMASPCSAGEGRRRRMACKWGGAVLRSHGSICGG
ncbi:PREDICTED: loricrin-like [Ficedula albicollis]|uniref:loricrin-like n=1 Tax=Ficedula albicollis TaxID=59894 RepID=UPI0007AD8C19|nr:PREDICTED: loricrin-like [Ficedula albicollis]